MNFYNFLLDFFQNVYIFAVLFFKNIFLKLSIGNY